MNLFFWKKNNTIDVFASSLANELFSTIQPQKAKEFITQSIDNQSEKKKKRIKEQKEKNKFETQIDLVVKHINEFKVINSLGVYGKARLHLKFSERLKELGYNESVTKKINDMIMVRTP